MHKGLLAWNIVLTGLLLIALVLSGVSSCGVGALTIGLVDTEYALEEHTQAINDLTDKLNEVIDVVNEIPSILK